MEKTPGNAMKVQQAFRVALRSLSDEEYNQLLNGIEDQRAKNFYMICRY